jgi:thiol-disulfide isomerase/thioredoxin/outer membrane murein-binding lipoprotein Lpp
MKKILFCTLAAVMMLAGCANAPIEEQIKDFQAKMEAFENRFNEGAAAIKEDAALTAEQQTEKISALSDKLIGELKDFCLKTIRKNNDNELGLEAFKNVQFLLDEDELEKTVSSLGATIKDNPAIKQVNESLQAKKATKAGQPFVDFTIVQDPENPETSTVKFSDYAGKGKYLLVDFWASWCGPCKAEIPNIKAVYEKYAGEDFDVLSVAVWDKPEASVKAAEDLGITWNQIINAQQVPTDLYGIEGIPHIMLVGPDGIILNRNLRGDLIEANVSRYVKAKK